MTHPPTNALFLCTGNSARSILAEAILNRLGAGRFSAFSAGSHPRGSVNPLALEWLQANGHDIAALRSKSWDEFEGAAAPQMDFVFTVCDAAAGEICPIWPGNPITAHWGLPDPAAVEGPIEDQRKAFSEAAGIITRRLRLFLDLPFEKLDRPSLQARVREAGHAA